MKTKSKRFLNLATLCLALLGTTLLTGQPVKAEGGDNSLVEVSGNGSTDGRLPSSEHRVDESSESEQIKKEAEAYQKGRDDGEEAGYQEGKKEDSPRVPLNDSPRPSSTPYDQNPTLQAEYGNGYSDAYLLGYNRGWEETNPIQSTLIWLWTIVTTFFGNLG
ncbi:hypothetical protein ACEN7M_00735 [Streptococcus pyogenes]|nr:hypothetical protein [Streptococcus pyogenes]VGQ43826.1 hypothetical membrane associated protein [Streptococcus pyogenes]VGQ45474.1 hypothetical membrane associated protein [Streptococcus pyogenes]VGQ75863.1 hypothetical membrane associated protein [Streptococcus pyogenes]VGU96977.1 Uncharacterised protein [Streptococcus pyogenes]VHC57729.1 Uncharacterised protein [Streptococcus pyogenes]